MAAPPACINVINVYHYQYCNNCDISLSAICPRLQPKVLLQITENNSLLQQPCIWAGLPGLRNITSIVLAGWVVLATQYWYLLLSLNICTRVPTLSHIPSVTHVGCLSSRAHSFWAYYSGPGVVLLCVQDMDWQVSINVLVLLFLHRHGPIMNKC